MQDMVTHFATAAKSFGLQVSIKRMEMMFQPSPGTDSHHQSIQISGEDLATLKEFKYLGSTATYNKLDTELQLQKAKASRAFGHLKNRVWFNKILESRPNMQSIVPFSLSTLLYRAESWKVCMDQAHSLNAYIMRYLKQILGVKWRHRIPSQDILMRSNMLSKYEATSLFTARGRAPNAKHWQA